MCMEVSDGEVSEYSVNNSPECILLQTGLFQRFSWHLRHFIVRACLEYMEEYRKQLFSSDFCLYKQLKEGKTSTVLS